MHELILVPANGVKGKTWGPSTLQTDAYRRSPLVMAAGRHSRSAPNLGLTLRHIGGHSNIGALQECGKRFKWKSSE